MSIRHRITKLEQQAARKEPREQSLRDVARAIAFMAAQRRMRAESDSR
jgi:hypothetical protein